MKTIYDLLTENYLKYEVLAKTKPLTVLWVQLSIEAVDRVGIIVAFADRDEVSVICEYCTKTEAIRKTAWLLEWDILSIPVPWGAEGQALMEELDSAQAKLRDNGGFDVCEDTLPDDIIALWRTPLNLWVFRESPCYHKVIDFVENHLR